MSCLLAGVPARQLWVLINRGTNERTHARNLRPTVASHDRSVCNPALGGIASKGGTITSYGDGTSGQQQLDLKFNCLKQGAVCATRRTDRQTNRQTDRQTVVNPTGQNDSVEPATSCPLPSPLPPDKRSPLPPVCCVLDLLH
eukprot:SAG22_NODE_3360_length_1758_cov_2.325497_1_plen_141_part_10